MRKAGMVFSGFKPRQPLREVRHRKALRESEELYRYLVAELNKLNLAYLHIMHTGDENLVQDLRNAWKQALLVNRPNATPENLSKDLKSGLADLVPVGKMALANPDLVARLKANAPLNEGNPATFFGGTEKGYTDYPQFWANSRT